MAQAYSVVEYLHSMSQGLRENKNKYINKKGRNLIALDFVMVVTQIGKLFCFSFVLQVQNIMIEPVVSKIC